MEVKARRRERGIKTGGKRGERKDGGVSGIRKGK